MNNAELIKALRYCADEDKICTEQTNCGYYGKGFFCQDELMLDAADALEAAEKRIAILEEERDLERFAAKNYLDKIDELEAQLPKEGEWLRTDAFPHRIYCSVCYKTYVPNDRWQIWVDGDIPKKFCPNCGARMRGEHDE